MDQSESKTTVEIKLTASGRWTNEFWNAVRIKIETDDIGLLINENVYINYIINKVNNRLPNSYLIATDKNIIFIQHEKGIEDLLPIISNVANCSLVSIEYESDFWPDKLW